MLAVIEISLVANYVVRMGSKFQASVRRGTSLPAAAALGLPNGLLNRRPRGEV